MGTDHRNEDQRNAAGKTRADRQNEVREGQEDSSIHGDPQPHAKSQYPRQRPADRQYDHQPEFLEPDSNKTDEKLEQDRQARKTGPEDDEG